MKDTFKNVWKIPELRERIFFTLIALIAFRIGIYIPVPGINLQSWQAFLEGLGTTAGGFVSFFDIFAGGALKKFSIFVLTVTPYINAAIILQLLASVIPSLKEMLREGEEGRKKFARITRQLTLFLTALQAFIMAFASSAYKSPKISQPLYLVISTISIMAGTMFLLWLGEMITEKGIGNGISVLIFAGIVARYPSYIASAFVGRLSVIEWIFLIAIALFTVVAIVFVQSAERRITVQYAKKVVGMKIYGGVSTYIPIKVNSGGVLPIIFAAAIMSIPQMLASITGSEIVKKLFGYSSPLYLVLYALLVFFFTYFYSAVVIDPKDISDNMRKYGGFIPGIRPGQNTANYIMTIVNRVTFLGAVFLVIIALLPYLVQSVSGINIIIGGTSSLIAVGVAMDILQQIEAHLIMRQYEGFMKKGRLRGRR